MKNIVKRLAEAMGYEITKTKRRHIRDLLRSMNIDHLVDVGANRGQFISLMRAAGYSGPATAFEPIAECRKSIKKFGNVRIFPNALGKVPSSAEINIYSATDFTSFHTLNDRYICEYQNAPVVKEIRHVDVLTLDEVNIPGRSILLKIDTQGAEADVLRGAVRTLERVSILFLELPFLQIYDGGCSVGDLFHLTKAANLFPTKVFANSILTSGIWVDGDVVFVKRS